MRSAMVNMTLAKASGLPAWLKGSPWFGWRFPRFRRKAGIPAKTSINGRGRGTIATAPQKRFGSWREVPDPFSPPRVTTV